MAEIIRELRAELQTLQKILKSTENAAENAGRILMELKSAEIEYQEYKE